MHNIHYNNFAFDFQGKTIRQKEKGPEKGTEEELKPEENRGSSVVPPKAAAVTANADELIMRYMQGAMQMNKPDKAAAMQTGVVEPKERDGNIGDLLTQWNNGHETMTREQKFNLLTEIINYYVDAGDSTQESIWRVRRNIVMFDHTAENLEIWNRMQNGGEYESPSYFGCGIYPGREDDMAAYMSMLNSYNSGTLTGDALFVYLEACVAMSSTDTLCYIINTNLPNATPEQIDTYKADAKNNADYMMEYIGVMVTNNFIEGTEWQDTYEQFQTKFDSFCYIINASEGHDLLALKPDGTTISAVENLVSVLTGLIEGPDGLREQGFPYCDELLIAIQGYLVYSGYDDINVLPNPAGGEGGAKPETVQTLKKESEFVK